MTLTCWTDVLICPCDDCRALAEIYHRCREAEEPLFVFDCRMHTAERPWIAAHVDELFVSASPADRRFESRDQALAFVLSRQRHADVFESSWPLQADGSSDFAWRREEAA